MTKQEAEKHIEEVFGNYKPKEYIHPLCTNPKLNSTFRALWCKHWVKINTKNENTMVWYLEENVYNVVDVEISLLRLLSLHLFIEREFK